MAQAKRGDKVRINFTGKLADGSLIDSTYPDPQHDCEDEHCTHEVGPMELVIGDEFFYVPVEEALIGMAPGDKKTVTIGPEDAFGDYNPENVFTVKR
ncbi:MAG: FKBP-type peptidyl-prolyl cis-trans isomerase, partial [Alphaproteobacteria bacterium]|nr:FKBP-type peptidyl-prolyl cis-trans isomerase [Alphaproteobacteria bacterium]